MASCFVPGDPVGAGTSNFFAYPGNVSSGEVYVYDVTNMVRSFVYYIKGYIYIDRYIYMNECVRVCESRANIKVIKSSASYRHTTH